MEIRLRLGIFSYIKFYCKYFDAERCGNVINSCEKSIRDDEIERLLLLVKWNFPLNFLSSSYVNISNNNYVFFRSLSSNDYFPPFSTVYVQRIFRVDIHSWRRSMFSGFNDLKAFNAQLLRKELFLMKKKNSFQAFTNILHLQSC